MSVDREQYVLEMLKTITDPAERAPYEAEYQEILAAKQNGAEPFTFEVNGQTINLRDYVIKADSVTAEKNYQVLKIALSQKFAELDAKHQADIENITALKDQQIQQQKSQMDASRQALESEIDDYKSELKEMESRLAAAAEENESLKIRVKELEATQEKTAYPTNLDSNALAQAIQEAQAAKPKIYNVRKGDNKGSYFVANVAETGEEIEIPWLDLGGYTQLSDEEAARFRAESEAQKAAALESVPEIPVDDKVIEPPELSFQSQETGVPEPRDEAISGVHGEGTARRMESLEARMTELEKRVHFLEMLRPDVA